MSDTLLLSGFIIFLFIVASAIIGITEESEKHRKQHLKNLKETNDTFRSTEQSLKETNKKLKELADRLENNQTK